VARYAESRCYGARGIGRWSSCRGQRESDMDDRDVLVHKQGQKHVREVRVIMLRKCDAVKDRGEVETHRSSSTMPAVLAVL
jgi:hypothetical protein